MSGFQQPPLPMDVPPIAAPDDPQIYVASALTHLDARDVGEVRRWSGLVAEAAVAAAMDDEPPWTLRVHQPVIFSDPRHDLDRTPKDVYDLNRQLVEASAALIVIGYRGASMGAGMELSWALGTRQPVLYLAPGAEPASRQVLGAPGVVTATFTEGDAATLAGCIVEFLRSNRAAIQDHPRRLADRELTYARAIQALADRFAALSPDERLGAVRLSRMPSDRFIALLTGQAELAGASVDELSALSGGLGVPLGDLFDTTPPPELRPGEVRVLETTAVEDGWTVEEALDLLLRARLERSRGGTRRLNLNSSQSWREFRRRTRHE